MKPKSKPDPILAIIKKRRRRELMVDWLYQMYFRACREREERQARAISKLIAEISRAEITGFKT